MGERLPRSFYVASASSVAPELLGMHLVRRQPGGSRMTGRIVEVEAYEGPHDLAAHSSGGRRTARTEVMFREAGHAYVYFIYGRHFCLNVVTAPLGVPHAVLIRAIEPVENIAERTQGPALLCRALAINMALNGADLLGPSLSVERPSPAQWRPPLRKASPRIGIGSAGEWVDKPWRFYDGNSAWVSGKRRGTAKGSRGLISKNAK